MDPNETLAKIRRAVALLRDGDLDLSDSADYYAELIDGVADLDQWISRGGFLPTAWAR